MDTLVKLYEQRLKHAEAELEYWLDEYALHGDKVSENAYRESKKTLGEVYHQLKLLKQPGTVVIDNPNKVFDKSCQ